MTTPKSTDIRPVGLSAYYLPVEARIPYRFGTESLSHVTCVRVCMEVEARAGGRAQGWGEIPQNVQWAWPSTLSMASRLEAVTTLCSDLAQRWATFDHLGHPIEVGHAFLTDELPIALAEANGARSSEPIPWLAALVANSAFDLALHDAYGNVHNVPTYATYTSDWMNDDLTAYLDPADGTSITFQNRYPDHYLLPKRDDRLPAWHSVGGNDLLLDSERTGEEPDDGYPVVLPDWIHTDGLNCLKIKLTGESEGWDYDRIVEIGKIAIEHNATWLSTDFNCTVKSADYVNDILDRLMIDHSRIFQMILYVEQPFPYDLEANPIDAHSVSARKPLFMDESAHDWRLLELGRKLGWTGVALKTCKTQTVAILSLCWARAHGMTVMVQDLTNPMLAQITHALLTAHAGTVMGLETNGMQFYPEASRPEAEIHPGVYRRIEGYLDLTSIRGSGFGYRLDEIERSLPEPFATFTG